MAASQDGRTHASGRVGVYVKPATAGVAPIRHKPPIALPLPFALCNPREHPTRTWQPTMAKMTMNSRLTMATLRTRGMAPRMEFTTRRSLG